MTVSEAMQLASLSAARVVAGQGGLGNAITGAIRAPHTIDTSKCIKCGVCMSNCHFDAISKG